jgi:hypothetical protein
MSASMPRGGVLTAALLGLAASLPAAAATVTLRDGGRLTVAPSAVADTGALGARPGLETLGWTLADARGRTLASDQVAASLRLSGGDPPVLEVDPASGRAFLVTATGDLSVTGLLLRAWTGQGFTEPVILETGDAAALQPALAFLPEGDAVLAWATPGGTPSLRLEHAALAESGAQRILSFSEVPDFVRFLRPSGEDVQVRPGLGHLALEAAAETAYAVLASDEGTDVGILALRLNVLDDIWGGSAAPVPVTVSSSSMRPAAHARDDGPAEPGLPAACWAVDFERVRVLDHDLYLWAEDGSTFGLLFRDGAASPLLSAPWETEAGRAAVLRAAWREVARSQDERGPSPSRRSGDPRR